MKRKIQIFFLPSFAIIFLFIGSAMLGQSLVDDRPVNQKMSTVKAVTVKGSKERLLKTNNVEDKEKKGTKKMEKEIKTEKALFGAGCFWGVEETFRRTPGVLHTAVGFSGGTVKNPSYEQVCQGDTKHAEVVEIEYDPEKISYNDLLKIFFANHNPTTLNRQGPDIGEQYRSVIFYFNVEQEKQAITAKKEWEAKTGKIAVTEIQPAQPFYTAEEYHQQYLLKRGLNVCH